MHLSRYICTGAAFIGLAGVAAFATPNTMHHMGNAIHPSIININMAPLGGSKQNGTARLSQSGNNVMVKIAIFNEPRGASQAAHIHRGKCPNINPVPYKGLRNVVRGTSVTTLPMNLRDLKRGQYAINVHDAKNPKRYVSCGDI
ncbi:MAG: hypothetical protein M3Z14_05185 [Candidatus Eremiobacteraeota bacterium]|nr:hypothetical protein [Candidatus Eremiobacteraeota bacterium]